MSKGHIMRKVHGGVHGTMILLPGLLKAVPRLGHPHDPVMSPKLDDVVVVTLETVGRHKARVRFVIAYHTAASVGRIKIRYIVVVNGIVSSNVLASVLHYDPYPIPIAWGTMIMLWLTSAPEEFWIRI